MPVLAVESLCENKKLLGPTTIQADFLKGTGRRIQNGKLGKLPSLNLQDMDIHFPERCSLVLPGRG